MEDTANSTGINRDDLLLSMMTDISTRLEQVEKRNYNKRCNYNNFVPGFACPTGREREFRDALERRREVRDATEREREFRGPTGRERGDSRPTEREREFEFRGIPIFETPEYEYRYGNLKLPREGWLKDPFEDIMYSGCGDKQNLMKFLRRFERIALYENISEADQLHYFGKCMRGSAANWFDVREPETG